MLNLEQSFTGCPVGIRAGDSAVHSLVVESAGRCAPEASLPPAQWKDHKWCNCLPRQQNIPVPG